LHPDDVRRIERAAFSGRRITDIKSLSPAGPAPVAPSRVRVSFDNGHRDFSAEEFHVLAGRALGWGVVKSPFYRIERASDGYTVSGRGLGHGVGLCQWGAAGMARAGKNFRQILAHYFPGSSVARWDELPPRKSKRKNASRP
jgi:SpoIID/LytB domain protein